MVEILSIALVRRNHIQWWLRCCAHVVQKTNAKKVEASPEASENSTIDSNPAITSKLISIRRI